MGAVIQACLHTAEQELVAGADGNKALRCTALQALRELVRLVDSAEALAFFLPGVVSGLSKQLVGSGAVCLLSSLLFLLSLQER